MKFEIPKKLKKYLLRHQAILFTSLHDVTYLTKFHSSNMKVFYLKGKWFAITDARYLEAATSQIKHMEVLNVADHPYKNLMHLMSLEKVTKIALDKNRTSVAQLDLLKELLGANIEFVFDDFSDLRQIKSDNEIASAKEAAKITDKILAKVKTEIKAGKTELYIKRKILQLIYETNATGPSFDPIVAAGPNGSKPHWRGSDYKIKNGDMITIDFGIFYNDIASDMTRTFFVGKIGNEKQKEIYDIVLKAQLASLKAIKPGVKCSDIDKIARDVIEEAGYGRFFTHGLGHSFGYEIHESPRFSQQNETLLEEGMLMTVEPGIYLPDQFGLRIEDCVVVTKKGFDIINKSSKKLEILK